MEKSKKIMAISAFSVLACLGAFSSAYFSDSEQVSNKFKVGQVAIEVSEASWDASDDNGNGIPDLVETIVPNQEFNKDPIIKNTGINDAYVYLEVKIPVASVICANDSGSKGQLQDVELFSMLNLDNENWKQLSHTKKDLEGNAVYIFGYKDKLSKDATTTKLFDKVKFANIIEGQEIEGQQLNIEVHAMAIQADETGSMEEAFNKYLAQNN